MNDCEVKCNVSESNNMDIKKAADKICDYFAGMKRYGVSVHFGGARILQRASSFSNDVNLVLHVQTVWKSSGV